MKKLIIAIDGPGAAGKSTVAKLLAKKMGYIYIDTGAMYRCLALHAIRNNIEVSDVDGLVKGLKEIDIRLDQSGKVFLNDEDVSSEIRGVAVTAIVSPVSYPRPVREILVEKQRQLALEADTGVVMDGRDIGTVVLTNADLKIYQIASPSVRAKRRYDENLTKGITTPLEIIEEEIKHRDYLDMNKGYGALKKADDAIELDTSDMSIEEVVNFIYERAMELM
jgi:cytidylate kinase